MGRTNDAIWGFFASWCKVDSWASPNVENRDAGDGLRNALTSLSAE